MKRALLISLSFLPGSVAILEGRAWLGTGLMVAGLFGWDFAVLGLSGLLHGTYAPILGTAALVVAAAATAISVFHTVRETSPVRRERARLAAAHALREGLKSFLRGDEGQARITVDSGLAVAPNDVDLVFFRWQIARAFQARSQDGNPETPGVDADRWLKRLKRIDDDEKWRWETKAKNEQKGDPTDDQA